MDELVNSLGGLRVGTRQAKTMLTRTGSFRTAVRSAACWSDEQDSTSLVESKIAKGKPLLG